MEPSGSLHSAIVRAGTNAREHRLPSGVIIEANPPARKFKTVLISISVAGSPELARIPIKFILA